MAIGESREVRNGVLATVVGGLALAILGELWPPVKTAISWVWGRTQAFFGLFGEAYPVPGWALVILSLLALVTAIRVVVGLRSDPLSPQASYIEDVLFGAKWCWSWTGGDISLVQHPFCNFPEQ